MSFTVGPGFTIGAGFVIGASSGGGGGGGGSNGVVGAAEMPLPVVPGFQLQDPSATVNGSVGFTINNDTLTGIAISNLTANNVAWVVANFPTVPAFHTCTWGPGSTVASSTIQVIQIPGPGPAPNPTTIVFFVVGQTGPATYNYPFTLSV